MVRHRSAAATLLAVALSACSAANDNNTMGHSNITELIKTDVVTGSGHEAVKGRRVTVHYTGWLYSEDSPEHKGRTFDSSRTRRDPFTFRLGAGEVIDGWDQGVAGMKVGGRRTLTVPPSLGYGPQGTPDGTIPPNATLVFDVELLDVR